MYTELLEAMDRRGFLKMLGKGAAAATAPKSALAKALTSIPTGGTPNIDAGKAVLDFFSILKLGDKPGELVDKYRFMNTALTNLLAVLTQNNINIGSKKNYNLQQDLKYHTDHNNTVIAYLTGKLPQNKDTSKLLARDFGIDTSLGQENAMDVLEADIEGLADGLEGTTEWVVDSVGEMFKKNLITPEAQRELEKRRIYKCDFVNDPESKMRKDKLEKESQKQYKDYMDRYNYSMTARDIDYSRMDRAGGSEDVGYAQTFEKFFVENYAKFLIDFQTVDDDKTMDFLDLQADQMWIPADEIEQKGLNQIKASELIYRNCTSQLTVKVVGLDPGSDGKEYFYIVKDESLLAKIAQFFANDKIIQGLISQGRVEFGININEENSNMNIFFYKPGTVNVLHSFLNNNQIEELVENYADGKKPGRKGLAKRKGVNCKQSVSKLRKVAKNSTGEKRRMAHWCANMKSGKKK